MPTAFSCDFVLNLLKPENTIREQPRGCLVFPRLSLCSLGKEITSVEWERKLPVFLSGFNQANKQGWSLQKHIAMHSHTARKLTQPWPWRQRALDNIMTAITSLKWPCFRSSVPFMFFSTGPFEFHPHVDAQFIFTIQFCLFIGLTPYLFLASLFSCHYFSVSVLFFWFKTRDSFWAFIQ